VAKLTISDAARVAGVSRVTLHRYIKAGKLSRSPDGTIDTAELLRIGLVLHSDTALQSVTLQRDVTPPETSPATSPDPATLQQLITVLQRELDAAHAREEATREREALLLQMLQQLQQQNQRLLDLPRSPPPPPPRPHLSTVASPAGPHEDPRGAMRRRIVTLLQDHPEGLTPAEIRDLLGAERSLTDTCLGMLRAGLLQRVEPGRYVAAAPAKDRHL
jgi:hypothetical protein